MNKLFNVNFERLIAWLLAGYMRRPIRLAWLWVLIKPVRRIHAELLAYRDNANWRATITGSKNRLRQALRQQFGDNTIEIVDAGLIVEPVFIYRAIELQTSPTIWRASEGQPPLYLRRASEFDRPVDFIVRIPASLAGSAAAIYEFTNRYRIAGRTFRVELFDGTVVWPVE